MSGSVELGLVSGLPPSSPGSTVGVVLPTLVFTVEGTPRPAGSKRSVPDGRGGSRIVDDAGRPGRAWRKTVAEAAQAAVLELRGCPGGAKWAGAPWAPAGPVFLMLRFYVARPKAHLGASGVLPSAPALPTVRPDVSKLTRSVEDSLTGIAWKDDAQVAGQLVAKLYGLPERVEVSVTELRP